MKRICLTVIGLLAVFSLLAGCGEKTKETTTETTAADSVSVDTLHTNKRSVTEKKVNKTVFQNIDQMTLAELIAEYKKNSTSELEGKDARLKILSKKIESKHLISAEDYKTYRDQYWDTNTIFEHLISKTELDQILASASVGDDYIKYKFTDSKDAKDFQYEAVPTHSFASFVSCFSVLMLKNIADDPGFKSLTITKGVKHITNSTVPDGDYDVAILLYKSRDVLGNPNTQYMDIVEDPTR